MNRRVNNGEGSGREPENQQTLLAGARCLWALVLAYAFLVWFSFLGGWRVFQ